MIKTTKLDFVFEKHKREGFIRKKSIEEEEGVGTRISSVFTRQRLGMSNSEDLGIFVLIELLIF